MDFSKVRGLTISEIDIMPRAVHNYYIKKDGSHSGTDANWISSDKIPVSEGAVVEFCLVGHTSVGSVVAYDSNGAVVGYAADTADGELFEGTYTVPAGATYITITGGTERIFADIFASQYAIITNGSFAVTQIDDESGNVLWQRGYRYIRFIINAIRNSGFSVTQFSELEFIDANDNVYSYPAGATASGNLTSPSGYFPNNVIDGDLNTKFFISDWSAGGYLEIDLGVAERIDLGRYSRFRWYTANDVDGRDPISFEVRFSNDGVNFDVGVAVTNASIPTTRKAIAYTGACLPS